MLSQLYLQGERMLENTESLQMGFFYLSYNLYIQITIPSCYL